MNSRSEQYQHLAMRKAEGKGAVNIAFTVPLKVFRELEALAALKHVAVAALIVGALVDVVRDAKEAATVKAIAREAFASDGFAFHDRVTWSSTAGGYTKQQTGVVVRVLRRDEYPDDVAAREFPNHRRMFDGWTVPGGGQHAYLVEVLAGPKARPRLYMPFPSKLRRVE